MVDNIITNLTNVGWAMLIFLCAYVSNMLFSMYYNIKILSEEFQSEKLLNSAIKILCIIFGLAALVTATTCLPEFANTVGWQIPKEYIDVFNSLAVLGVCLVVSCKYIFEAVQKFSKILNDTKNIEME